MTDPKIPAALADTPIPVHTQKQSVDPWNVQGVNEDGTVQAINYKKLVDEFGTKLIDEKLLERFERVTGHKPHRFMRRGIVFSHRELEEILDRYEKGQPFFLYTGRGPSSTSIHLGHVTPFMFTKWLQDVFDVPLVIMLTDDEKYLFSENRTIEEVEGYSRENAKDIIACGFDPDKTFIFSDYRLFETGAPGFYKNVTKIAKRVTYNQAKAIFGFDDSTNIGRVHFASIQAAASFASSFPHIFGSGAKVDQIPSLIPCAIDQDPYFRMTRDVAVRAHLAKPSLIHSRFLDALQGPGSKMSASVDSSAIFMTDTAKQIKTKINRHAFSGGQETEALHREKGGNVDVDVPYSYLTFFLEDDEQLRTIAEDYRSGKLLTGEMKALCIKELQEYVQGFQERRAKVTDEVLDLFMAKRPLKWGGNPNVVTVSTTAVDGNGPAEDKDGEAKAGEVAMTKNQMKKLQKMKQYAEKKAQKAKAKEPTAAASTPAGQGAEGEGAAAEGA